MTREEAKKLLPIMQAFIEGKTIQYESREGWIDLDSSYPHGSILSKYRIKPEPKYRAFESQEECWNEMHKHPDFGFIKEKGTKVIYSIAMIDNFYLSTHDRSEHLGDTLAFFEFTDGTPFGIKLE